MTSDEAMEVLGYLLVHEKAVDSGEMEDVQNCLNSQEQEVLKVVLSEFRELKEKATAKKVKRIYEYGMFDCPHCNKVLPVGKKYPHCTWCGGLIDYYWSEGKE